MGMSKTRNVPEEFIKRSTGRLRTACHQKEARQLCDYIIIQCDFWNKYVDFISANIPYPHSWIFPEHLNIRWQVAVVESLLVVMGLTGLFQFNLVKYYV
jgi:hypothetical protein